MHTFRFKLIGRPSRQRGVGTLFVALMLLLGGTILAFFANRSFIFEQRTSANQYRATKAFELAEAGVDWAVGRLNDGMAVSTATADSCDAENGGATPSFRARYVSPQQPDLTHPNPWFNVPVAGALPGCRFDPTSAANGGWSCSCPTGTNVAVLGTPDQGRFGVRFNPVADTSAVEIVSRGCSNVGAATDVCDPGAQPTGDATAVVRVLVKLRPYVTSGPAAALTTGSATTASGNLNVINYFSPSNGITIHAGTTVQMGSGTNVFTLPGTPSRASILDNDPTLADTTMLSDDQFFSRFFGESLDSYRARAVYISGCSAQDCATRVMQEIDRGVDGLQIYVDGNIQFTQGIVGASSTGTIGTSGRPIILVYSGALDMQGTVVGHGIFYAATSSATAVANPGGGTATIFGAFVSRGGFEKQGSGTFNIIYTPSLWSSGRPNGLLLRVPGSWRDKLDDY